MADQNPQPKMVTPPGLPGSSRRAQDVLACPLDGCVWTTGPSTPYDDEAGLRAHLGQHVAGHPISDVLVTIANLDAALRAARDRRPTLDVPAAGLSIGTLTVDLVPADQVPSYGVRAELVHDTLTAAQPGDMFSFEQAPGQRVTVVVARSYAVEQPKIATPPARAFLGERPCSDPGCACHGPDPLAGPPLGNLRKPPRPAGPKPVA